MDKTTTLERTDKNRSFQPRLIKFLFFLSKAIVLANSSYFSFVLEPIDALCQSPGLFLVDAISFPHSYISIHVSECY